MQSTISASHWSIPTDNMLLLLERGGVKVALQDPLAGHEQLSQPLQRCQHA